MDIEALRFPIGKYVKPEKFTKEIVQQYLEDISTFPQRLKKEVVHLSDEQLNTEYRPNGWSIRQVVHHCADSHMNALIRFKLALTEHRPTIKPYLENRWATLSDAVSLPIEPSIKILEGVHERWTVLLFNLTEDQLNLSFIHPEHGREIFLNESMGMYAWHGNHHLSHITTLKKSREWK